MRVSGPRAGAALQALAGRLPKSRRATLCRLCAVSGEALDEGLALWFPGPRSATGEDLAELHLHGGRAVVAAVLSALDQVEGLRPAAAGEFTRRAFENGRIDLAEAEGLADLLAAETESQRASALMLAGGGLGRRVDAWQAELLRISALVEASLDFSDEGDVGDIADDRVFQGCEALARGIAAMLEAPPVERLRDGVKVVLGGPPNSGKSSLINVLAGRDVAIVTDVAGTTRDRIEVPVAFGDVPLVLTDTAGLRSGGDAIEAIGIARAEAALAEADIILWLGDAGDAPLGALLVAAKSDLDVSQRPGLVVSAHTGEGVDVLKSEIIARAHALLPKPGALALNQRHRGILKEVLAAVVAAAATSDGLITAEHLREARAALDRLTGRAGVEDMLDALFGGFCVGK